MKVSRKMSIMIILKVTKNQGVILSLEDAFLKNHRGDQIDSPPPPPLLPAVLELIKLSNFFENLPTN